MAAGSARELQERRWPPPVSLELLAAVTRLQAFSRGHLQRKYLEELRKAALACQRLWRGHKGRCRFRALRAQRDTELRQEYFTRSATIIQQCWRGHRVRRDVHSCVARRAYLGRVAARSAEVRQLAEEDRGALLRARGESLWRSRQAADQEFLENSHHLISTASSAGVLVGADSTAAAGGRADREEALNSLTRERVHRALLGRNPKLLTAWVEGRGDAAVTGSVYAASPYDACEAAARLERAVQSRVARAVHGSTPFRPAVKVVPHQVRSLASQQGGVGDPVTCKAEAGGKHFGVAVHRQSLFETTLPRARGLLL